MCTSCCGVVWCAGCLLVAFIERLPHPIKCTQCDQPLATLRLQTRTVDVSVARTQSVTIPPPWTWTLGRHTRRLIAMPVDKRRGSLVLAVTVHPVVALWPNVAPVASSASAKLQKRVEACPGPVAGVIGPRAPVLAALPLGLRSVVQPGGCSGSWRLH